MQINAPQINFQALVTPQAPTAATPQLNAEAGTAQNANSFARLLQNRQQGAAMQATAMEHRAAEAPIKAPPRTPSQPAHTSAQTPAPVAPPASAAQKTADRTVSSRLPQRSDGPRTQASAQKEVPTRASQASEAADRTTDDDIRVDPADGPVVGLSEWWVPLNPSQPAPTPTGPTPVDNDKGAAVAQMPIRVGPLPPPTGGVKTEAPPVSIAAAAAGAAAASADVASAEPPICLAPEASGEAALANGLPSAATDATMRSPVDAPPSAAALGANGVTPPAATHTPAATLPYERDDAIGRADVARNAAMPTAGSAFESLARSSGEATRTAAADATRTPAAALRADRDDASGRADVARNAATPTAGSALDSLSSLGEAARTAAAAAPVRERRSFAETLAAAAPAGVPTARSEGNTAAAQVTVSIATPATAPEFREALGVQVSLLVKDGVQSAELHLNPADMGPISIQITTDGTQAQVDFGADSAITRQIIEQGLPELAGALRDAGITLTGGGVSQHARGQSDDARSAGDGRRSTRRLTIGDSDAEAPAVRSVQTSRGQVDLYA